MAPARSSAHRSATSDTTTMIDASRRGSVHTVQGFCVSMLPQALQMTTLSSAVCIAAASGAISGSRFLMRWSAARRAERGPSPGRRASSWIRRSISGPAMTLGMPLLHVFDRRRAAQSLDELVEAEQRALVLQAWAHLGHRLLEERDEPVLVDHTLLHQEAAGQHVTREEAGDRRRQRFDIDFLVHGLLHSGGCAGTGACQNNFKPGGNGSPPVRLFILSCMTSSALRRASPWAARTRSSTISFSSAFNSEASIDTPFMSPLALSLTLTRPPPAMPSTSIWSSSFCISCIFVCSWATCFIRPMKSAMGPS